MAERLAHGILALGLMTAATACQPVGAPTTQPPVTATTGINVANASAIARAEQAAIAGDLVGAREGFAAVLRSDPNSVPGSIGLAEAYLALGERDAAFRLFDTATRHAHGPERARIAQGRGLIALHREDLADARRELSTAVDLDPRLWRAWIGLGRLHARAGERNAARVAFAQAEANADKLGSVMNDIGMSYLLEREPGDAATFFERALVVDPDLEVARGNLRIARALGRQYEIAVAGAAPGDLADTLNNVGYIAVVNGDFDVADRFLRRAVEVSPVYHEAAVANLNLLAHAQLSGQRPDPRSRLSRAERPAEGLERKASPVALAPLATEPQGEQISLAIASAETDSPGADAAVLEDPAATRLMAKASVPETVLENAEPADIGFRWDHGQGGAAPALAAGSPVAHDPDPDVASTASSASSARSNVAVSDRKDAGPFQWADPTGPIKAQASADVRQ